VRFDAQRSLRALEAERMHGLLVAKAVAVEIRDFLVDLAAVLHRADPAQALHPGGRDAGDPAGDRREVAQDRPDLVGASVDDDLVIDLRHSGLLSGVDAD
jgi:hypothetical protein